MPPTRELDPWGRGVANSRPSPPFVSYWQLEGFRMEPTFELQGQIRWPHVNNAPTKQPVLPPKHWR